MEDKRQGIVNIDISQEMKNSYMDYAMSVIVSRALPDVRDGLKPVHRRILYAMDQLNLEPQKPHRKSARIVGDVLGKYHPHGDTSVYNAMVRLAQDFSIRYLLVDGHGNFGSIDGDSAAAMRYTEARMTKLAVEMLRDIEKDTVDWNPNFDESLKEPQVLPSKFPNLLVNGSNGIAVGMATSIPPHNLDEVISAAIRMIDDEDCDIEDIISIIKGPDFPTGAIIMGKDAIKSAYRTGRGKVTIRSQVEIEDIGKGKSAIIVREIPYQVNKSKLIEGIADLVRSKKIEGISDLRDESDRTGIRIYIELKKDVNAKVIINKLYKHSQLQTTFSIIMIALVDGQPKLLNIYDMLSHYIKHQKDIITKRTKYELKKAEERAHILEGLKIALDNIDAVIKLIRASKTATEAKSGLISEFSLSSIQAQAILDMRLQRLTGLERSKIEDEYQELLKVIYNLKEILGNDRLILDIVKKELTAIKNKFKDARRTKIIAEETEIDIEDLIDREDVFITLTHLGYIKRVPATTYTSQKRGGKGISGLSTRAEDFVENIFITSTHNYILFFTNHGRVHRIKAYEIPDAKRQAKGMNIVNLLYLEPNEKITAVIPIKEFTDTQSLVMATRNGMIKKTILSQFNTHRKTGLIAITLKESDELISVKLTNGQNDICIVTKNAMSIKFRESDVREMGRNAIGVKAINLKNEDFVVDMGVSDEGHDILVVSENGYGKRTNIEEYRLQTRGGVGIKTYSINSKTGKLAGAKLVNDEDEIMLINKSGIVIRLKVEGISQYGRATQGVRLMKLNDDDSIVSIAKLAHVDVADIDPTVIGVEIKECEE